MTDPRPSDCPHPGCTWRNLFKTCQDGSREYEAYKHQKEKHS